ncbi:MAG: hypothetical protein K2N12_02115 [Helicobacter sp.]|nr:hypothetical protein [Helicobacter sp.]
MKVLLSIGIMLVALFLNACSLQRQASAVEIGCEADKVVFPKGESSLFMPQYWEANCGNRKYVCQPSGIAIFQAPSAKCKELVP